MNFERKEYTTRAEKQRDFWIGVGLWFIVNVLSTVLIGGLGLVLGSVTLPETDYYQIITTILGCLPLLVNVGVLIYFGITRAWLALGYLAVYGFLFGLVIIGGIILTIACFVILGANASAWPTWLTF